MPKPVAPEDKNVRIPAAAQRAAAKADKLHREIYSPPQPEAPAPELETTAAAAPTQDPEQVTSVVTEAPAPQPGAEPQPQPETPPAENWEHKYKSLKGRFDHLNEAYKEVTTRRATAPAPEPVQPPSELSFSRRITDKDKQEFGDEFLDTVGRQAYDAVAPEILTLKQEIARLTGQLTNVGEVVVGDARARLERDLTDQVPNWRELNVDQRFLDWLALPDTYSGSIRHELLKAAYDRNDSRRVVAFFNGFLAEEAAVAPAPIAEPETVQPQTRQAQIPLSELAAPGRAKTAASSIPAEKPIFTRAQITRFYADVAAGRYRGDEAKKDQLEKQIFQAEREGRIR